MPVFLRLLGGSLLLLAGGCASAYHAYPCGSVPYCYCPPAPLPYASYCGCPTLLTEDTDGEIQPEPVAPAPEQ
jgi:hypothetical protein